MFFCDGCAKKKGWETSWLKSLGPCEVCECVAVCNDVKSSNIREIKQ